MPKIEDFQRALNRQDAKTARLLNPDIFGPAPRVDSHHTPCVDQLEGALVRRGQPQKKRARRVTQGPRFRVTLVAFTWNELDPDQLGAALKHVQDVVAELLGVDDGDKRRVRWQYGNVPTRGRQGVLVQVEEEEREIANLRKPGGTQ